MIKRPAEADSPRSPRWVRAAARLPLAFAQVREDPEIDRRVADRLPARARVCLVASGGCTAALLAAHPRIAALQAVAPNPAQLALARLKLSLLEEEPRQRLGLLGHSAMRISRPGELLDLADDALREPARRRSAVALPAPAASCLRNLLVRRVHGGRWSTKRRCPELFRDASPRRSDRLDSLTLSATFTHRLSVRLAAK